MTQRELRISLGNENYFDFRIVFYLNIPEIYSPVIRKVTVTDR